MKTADLKKTHELSDKTRKITMRKCWWVYFDVNGNAPSDADIIPCATKELAEEVLSWFRSQKDDDAEPYVVIDGVKHSEMTRMGVDGYNFDTYYSVREGWAEDSSIMTSLVEVVKASEVFEFHEPTQEPDGVYFPESEDTDEEDSEDEE